MSERTLLVEDPETGRRYRLEPGVRVGWARNDSDGVDAWGEIVKVNRRTVDCRWQETIVRLYPHSIRAVDADPVRQPNLWSGAEREEGR